MKCPSHINHEIPISGGGLKSVPHSVAVFAAVTFLFAVLCNISFAAAAAVPQTIGYQGTLTSSGSAVTGSQAMTFRLYDAATGGTLLWTETQPTVSVSGGFFSVALGSVTPLPTALNQALYLEVQIGATTLAPRQSINAVPFSLVTYSALSTSSAPTSPVGGLLYYNSTTGGLFVYDAVHSAWVDTTVTSGGSGSFSTLIASGTSNFLGPVNVATLVATSSVNLYGTTTINILNATGSASIASTTLTGNTLLTSATSTNFFSTNSSSTNLYSNVANLGTLTAGSGAFGSSTVTGTSTSQGLAATFASIINSIINNLIAATLTTYSATVGTLTATSSLTSNTQTTLASTTLTGSTLLTGSLTASGNTLLTNATSTSFSTTNLYVGGTNVGTSLANLSSTTAAFSVTNISSTGTSTFATTTSASSSITNANVTNLFSSVANFTNATSTNLFATTASSSNLFSSNAQLGNLLLLGSTTLQSFSGTNGTTTNFFSTNASTTNLFAYNATSSNFFSNAAGFTNATSTSWFSTTASSTNLFSAFSIFGNSSIINLFATTSSSTNLNANVATLGSVAAGSSTITGTSTTNGLAATFANLITSIITTLTASIANITTATIATLTGSTATIGTETVGSLTATSTTSLASTTVSGSFAAQGTANLNGGANVAALVASSSAVLGNESIAGTLAVSGTSTFATTTMSSTTIGVANIGTLNVSSLTVPSLSLSSTLSVTGTSTLATTTMSSSTITNANVTNLFSSIATFGNATSTNSFATTASSTNLFSSTAQLGNLLILSSTTLQAFSGTNGTTTNFFSTTASTTNFFAYNATSSNFFSNAAGFTNATSTSWFSTTASSTNLFSAFSIFGNSTTTNAFISSLIASNSSIINLFATTSSSTNLFANTANLGILNLSNLATFANGFVSQASSTVVGPFTVTGITALGSTLSAGTTTVNSLVVSNLSTSTLSGNLAVNQLLNTNALIVTGSATSTFAAAITAASGNLLLAGATPSDNVVLAPYGGEVGIGGTPTGKLSINQGTLTSSEVGLKLIGTWNAGATTFTGIQANMTDTASGASSLLMDLQTNGVSQFKVTKTGTTTINGAVNIVGTTTLSKGLDLNSNRIVNLADPVNNTDAATKQFVTSLAAYSVTYTAPVYGFATSSDSATTTAGVRYIDVGNYTGQGTSSIVLSTGSAGVYTLLLTPATSTTPASLILATSTTAFVDSTNNQVYNFNGTTWVSIAQQVRHNDTYGLQGGDGADFYHLKATDYNALTSVNAQLTNLQTSGSPSFASTTFTAAVSLADGTVALPSLTFNNDNDTGFFRPATNQIAVVTGGVQRLLFDNLGNITTSGTVSPANINATNATTSTLFSTIASSTNLFSAFSILGNSSIINLFATTSSSTNLYANTASIGILNLSNLATFANGFVSQASSTVVGLLSTIYSSTTALTASGTGYFGTASTTNLTLSSTPSSILSTNGSGGVGALTIGNGLSFSANTLALTFSTTTGNTWTGLQSFSNTGTTTFSGGIESGTKISAPYFIATSSTATSTFAGNILSLSASSTNLFANIATFGTFAAGSLNLSGLSTFASGLVSQASSTVVGVLTTTYGSTTALTISGNSYLGIATSSSLNANTATIGTLTAGTLSLTSLTLSGLGTFAGGFVSQASSTIVGAGTITGATTLGSTLGVTGLSTLAAGYVSQASSTVVGAFTGAGAVNFNSTLNLTGIGTLAAGFVSQASSTVVGLLTTTYGSTTALTISGNSYLGIATSTSLNANTATIGSLTSSGTGSFGNGAFTSTTGTSTIASGQGFTIGGSQFVVQQGSGFVGIGTTSPFSRLSVDANISSPSFSIASGTATYFTVANSGNVGIGTTSPSNLLAVSGSNTSFTGISLSNTSAGGKEFWLTSTGNAAATGGGKFGFWDNNVGLYRMMITSNGDIGMGGAATSPKTSLQISASTTGPSLPATGYAGNSSLYLTNNDASYGLLAGSLSSGNSYLQTQRTDGTATTYNLLLQPNGGNVGIGTTTPENTLTIAGSQKIYPSSGSAFINLQIPTNANYGQVVFNDQTGLYRGYLGYIGSNGGLGARNDTVELGTLGKDLTFRPNESEVMRLTSSGNVGIGTTNPLDKLSISASAAAGVGGVVSIANGATATVGNSAEVDFRNASQFGTVFYSGKIRSVMTNASSFLSDLAFNTYDASGPNGLEVMRLTSAGNVGIGTTSPALALDVRSDANGDAGVQTTNANTGGSAIAKFQASNGPSNAWFGIGGSSYSGYAGIRAGGASIYTANANGIGLTADNASGFITLNTGAGGTERLRVTGTGNVGIGTSNPLRTLEVSGNANIYATSTPTTLANARQLTIGEASNNTDYRLALGYYDTGAGFSSVIQSTNAGSGAGLLLNPSGGNVGIGTTTPGYKLDVQGAGNQLANFLQTTNTSPGYIVVSNGSGSQERAVFGVEGSAGGTAMSGSLAYATVINDVDGHGLQLGTSNTARMTINSAGNVGIGVTNPNDTLDIENSGSGIRVGNNSGNYLRIYDDSNQHIEGSGGTTLWIQSAGGGPISRQYGTGMERVLGGARN